MAEQIFKELKTKIALKTLTLSEWDAIKDTYKPLRGEVCVCEIPTGATVPTANSVTPPTVLFKVGDGVNVWNALNWASALAADVYAWAKKPTLDVNDLPTLPITIVDPDAATKKFITGISYADNKLTITRSDVDWGDVKNAPDFALAADLGNVSTLTTTAKVAVAAINEHDAEIGNLASLNTENKGNLVAAINEALQAVEVGGTGSVVTVAKETTPTEGSEVTYTVKQGGKAVDVKIEIPKYDTEADYGVLEVKGDAASGVEVDKTDAQRPIVKIKANTYDAYGAADDLKDDLLDGTIAVKKADSATEAGHAGSADEAGHAVSADNATNAANANHAGYVDHSLTVGSKTFNGAADVTITAADLGLDAAMHFVGAYATAPTKAFAGTSKERNLADGDVYLNTANNTEYVYSAGKWVELGNEGSHALKTVKIEGTGYLTGGGDLTTDRTIDIADAVKTKIDNGATAYSWGDHAEEGYAHKVDGATANNFAALDANGDLVDSGKKAGDFATAAQGEKADSAVQSVSLTGGTNNGTLKLTVDGKATDNIAVTGLGGAAYKAEDHYLTVEEFNNADTDNITVDGKKISLASELTGVNKITGGGDSNVLDFDAGNGGGSVQILAYRDVVLSPGGTAKIGEKDIATEEYVGSAIANSGHISEVKLIEAKDAEGKTIHSGLKVQNNNEIAIDDEVIFILNANF